MTTTQPSPRTVTFTRTECDGETETVSVLVGPDGALVHGGAHVLHDDGNLRRCTAYIVGLSPRMGEDELREALAGVGATLVSVA